MNFNWDFKCFLKSIFYKWILLLNLVSHLFGIWFLIKNVGTNFSQVYEIFGIKNFGSKNMFCPKILNVLKFCSSQITETVGAQRLLVRPTNMESNLGQISVVTVTRTICLDYYLFWTKNIFWY